MSLLDLIIVGAFLVVSHFVAFAWGVLIWIVGALIVARFLKGERI